MKMDPGNGARYRLGWNVAVVLVVAAYPVLGGDPYLLSLFNFGFIALLLALSLVVLLGYAGQISLGQGAFYGIGAYAAAILTTRLDLPFFAVLVLGPLLAGSIGYLVSRRISHLEPFYLAMATLVIGIIAVTFFSEAAGITGGPNGLPGIPAASLFGFEFTDDGRFFYLALAIVLLTLVATSHLRESRTGRALRAIKGDEAAAYSMGINVPEMKARAFALSGAICGLAGVLYAHHVQFISPETFGLGLSINVVVLAIVGGINRWPGAVLGALFLTVMTEALRGYEHWSEVIYGVVLFVVLLLFPNGILGLWEKARDRIYGRQAPSAPATGHAGTRGAEGDLDQTLVQGGRG